MHKWGCLPNFISIIKLHIVVLIYFITQITVWGPLDLIELVIADQFGDFSNQLSEEDHAARIQNPRSVIDVGQFDRLKLAQIKEFGVVHLPGVVSRVLKVLL